MKKLTLAIATASALMGATAAQAEVEVSASAAVSNMYLWRGQNLGSQGADDSANAVPAVSGDLVVSAAGAYAGVWTSSGDTFAGQEYDIFAGYGGEAGALSYDLSVWAYVYPDGGESNGTFGDNSEVILSLGFADASVSIYKQVGDEVDNDNMYYTVGYGVGPVSATYGMADGAAEDGDYSHLDVSYAHNDNLSFTLSKIVSEEEEDTYDTDTKVVVTYSLPIEL